MRLLVMLPLSLIFFLKSVSAQAPINGDTGAFNKKAAVETFELKKIVRIAKKELALTNRAVSKMKNKIKQTLNLELRERGSLFLANDEGVVVAGGDPSPAALNAGKQGIDPRTPPGFGNPFFKKANVESKIALSAIMSQNERNVMKAASMPMKPAYRSGWLTVSSHGGSRTPDTQKPEFAALWYASKYRIIRRICDSCCNEFKEIYYKRLTNIESVGHNLLTTMVGRDDLYFSTDYINTGSNNIGNRCNIDYTLHSTYEDAKNGVNPWWCQTDHSFRGFPGKALPDTTVPAYKYYDNQNFIDEMQTDYVFQVEDSSWLPIVGSGLLNINGYRHGVSIEERNLQNVRQYIHESMNSIIRRSCMDCAEGYRDIYYQRLSEIPDTLFESLLLNFKNKFMNEINIDYVLYSSYEDALNRTNAWEGCDRPDPGREMGFPALCRPNMGDVVDPSILNMWSTFHENMIGGTDVKEGKNNVAFYIEKDHLPETDGWMTVDDEMNAFMYPNFYGEELESKNSSLTCMNPTFFEDLTFQYINTDLKPYAMQGRDDPYAGWYDLQGCGKCNDWCGWWSRKGDQFYDINPYYQSYTITNHVFACYMASDEPGKMYYSGSDLTEVTSSFVHPEFKAPMNIYTSFLKYFPSSKQRGAYMGADAPPPPSYDYVGCYLDKFPRALTNEGKRNINECHSICRSKMYEYFGRGSDGVCGCGNINDYSKYGESNLATTHVTGIEYSIPDDSLRARGWHECHTSDYAKSRGNIDEDDVTKGILEKCLGEEIMYSCRPKESSHINNMMNCFAEDDRMYVTDVRNNIYDYIDSDNDGIGIAGKTLSSAYKCQQWCLSKPNCNYFSFWPSNGRCHLQQHGAKKVSIPNNQKELGFPVTTGGKECATIFHIHKPGYYSGRGLDLSTHKNGKEYMKNSLDTRVFSSSNAQTCRVTSHSTNTDLSNSIDMRTRTFNTDSYKIDKPIFMYRGHNCASMAGSECHTRYWTSGWFGWNKHSHTTCTRRCSLWGHIRVNYFFPGQSSANEACVACGGGNTVYRNPYPSNNGCLTKVNDGLSHTTWSPFLNYKIGEKNFIGYSFNKAIPICGFQIATNRHGNTAGDFLGIKEFEITTDNNPGVFTTNWEPVGSKFTLPDAAVNSFEFNTCTKPVTGIRLTVGDLDVINELNIFGSNDDKDSYMKRSSRRLLANPELSTDSSENEKYSTRWYFAGYGNRDKAFAPSGNEDSTKYAGTMDGTVQWYFDGDSSIGLASYNDTLNRLPCDNNEPNSMSRICWHTTDNKMDRGYRCGDQTNIRGHFQRAIWSKGSHTGIEYDISERSLLGRGWKQCFSSKIPSSDNAINDIQDKCEGDEILYSCRVDDESSDSDWNIVGYGSREKAFTPTNGQGAGTQDGHIQWHFSTPGGIGFTEPDNTQTFECNKNNTSKGSLCWKMDDSGGLEIGSLCGNKKNKAQRLEIADVLKGPGVSGYTDHYTGILENDVLDFKSLHVTYDLGAVHLINKIWRYRLFGTNEKRKYSNQMLAVSKNGKFNGEETVVYDTGDNYGDIETVDGQTINFESIVKGRYVRSWCGGSNYEEDKPHFNYFEIYGVLSHTGKRAVWTRNAAFKEAKENEIYDKYHSNIFTPETCGNCDGDNVGEGKNCVWKISELETPTPTSLPDPTSPPAYFSNPNQCNKDNPCSQGEASGKCCSNWGWCGTDHLHCEKANCVANCWEDGTFAMMNVGPTSLPVIKSTERPTTAPTNVRGGNIYVQYYKGAVDLDEIYAFTSFKSDWVSNINFADPTSNFATSGLIDEVGAAFEGTIMFPSAGEWTFHLKSVDGSMLKIDDTPIVSHGGLHAPRWKSGSVVVYPGEEMKQISVTFFEATGRVILVLEWESEFTERQVVPKEAFIDSEGNFMSHCGTESMNKADYRGMKRTTQSGKQCQNWDSNEYHVHEFKPTKYPYAGLVNNHCRNPDNDPGGPWCVTKDNSAIVWEYCDIPKCPKTRAPTVAPSATPTISQEPTKVPSLSKIPSAKPSVSRPPSKVPSTSPSLSLAPTQNYETKTLVSHPSTNVAVGKSVLQKGPDPEVSYLGCFKDGNNRALPVRKGSGRTTSQCIELCKGYNFVARQWYGECWCGDDETYNKYGTADDCICEGANVGGFRNCVYAYSKNPNWWIVDLGEPFVIDTVTIYNNDGAHCNNIIVELQDIHHHTINTMTLDIPAVDVDTIDFDFTGGETDSLLAKYVKLSRDGQISLSKVEVYSSKKFVLKTREPTQSPITREVARARYCFTDIDRMYVSPIDSEEDGIDGHPRSVESTPFKCQERCEALQECKYFTFWQVTGGCNLQVDGAILVPVPVSWVTLGYPVVTGPRDCESYSLSTEPGAYTGEGTDISQSSITITFASSSLDTSCSFAGPAIDSDFVSTSSCGYSSRRQTDYRGHLSVANNGFECISWQDAPDYYNDDEVYNPQNYPTSGLANNNFCRNPSNHREGAWCYTSNPETLWDFCNVTLCESLEPSGKSCFINVNDGVYGIDSSWVPGNAYENDYFIGYSFDIPIRICGFEISSDKTGESITNFGGEKTFEATTEANPSFSTSVWDQFGSPFFLPDVKIHSFKLNRCSHPVTGIRLKVAQSDVIDEFKIFTPIKYSSSLKHNKKMCNTIDKSVGTFSTVKQCAQVAGAQGCSSIMFPRRHAYFGCKCCSHLQSDHSTVSNDWNIWDISFVPDQEPSYFATTTATTTVTTTEDSLNYYHLLTSPEQITTRKLGTIVNPPTDYILHFTIEPLGTISSYGAILLFTNNINSNSGNYGDRTPGVWFEPDSTRLHFITGTNVQADGGIRPPNDTPLNVKTSVRIEILGTTRKVFVNDVEVFKDSIGTRSELAEVDVYLGNLFYDAANAIVSNVIFTNNNEIAFAVPTATFYGGSAHRYHSPLQLCEGDCDKDSHCAAGLRCFRRDGFSQIPGCNGNGEKNADYCVRRDDGRRLILDNNGAGIGLCGELSPLPGSKCPSDQVIGDMSNCKNVDYGNLCESDGECISDTIDNCGSGDVFVKTKPLDPYSLVKSFFNDKCMTLSKDNNVTFNSCTGDSRQNWYYSSTESTIINEDDGQCLSVISDSTVIATSPCNDGSNQQWVYLNEKIMITLNGTWCLDYDTNSTGMSITACHSSSENILLETQKFYFDDDAASYEISLRHRFQGCGAEFSIGYFQSPTLCAQVAGELGCTSFMFNALWEQCVCCSQPDNGVAHLQWRVWDVNCRDCQPTSQPIEPPTTQPTLPPTTHPSLLPTTKQPSKLPSLTPSTSHSFQPSISPTDTVCVPFETRHSSIITARGGIIPAYKVYPGPGFQGSNNNPLSIIDGDHSLDVDIAFRGTVENGEQLYVTVDLGLNYLLTQVTVWHWYGEIDGEYAKHLNQQVAMSATGDFDGEEVVVNLNISPEQPDGNIVYFDETNARFVRHLCGPSQLSNQVYFIEIEIRGLNRVTSDQKKDHAFTTLPYHYHFPSTGEIDVYAGWYDIQRCGQCNDWCSWVGPKRDGFGLDPRYRERTETDYFACKLSGGHTSEDGYTDKEFFKDGFHYQKCDDKGAETPDYIKEKFMGCFNEDINDRALTTQIGSNTVPLYFCVESCRLKGFHYASRTGNGECYCGSTKASDKTFSIHGEIKSTGSDFCGDCNGDDIGSNRMCVYQIVDQFDPEIERMKHPCTHIASSDMRRYCYVACRDKEESNENLLTCRQLTVTGIDSLNKVIAGWSDSPLCDTKSCEKKSHPLGDDVSQSSGTH